MTYLRSAGSLHERKYNCAKKFVMNRVLISGCSAPYCRMAILYMLAIGSVVDA